MAFDEKIIEDIVKSVLEEQYTKISNEKIPEIPVGVSARHIHLTKEHLQILFGTNQLTPMKELMGGQYAAQEQVTIVGSSLRAIEKVRVLGPLRKATQVEISRTDTFVLKVKPPVRPSGQIEGSAGITIIGPKGVVVLDKGCIIANRHIHMTPQDAKLFGVKDNQFVDCMAEGERRTKWYDVQIRVDPSYSLEMHVDTDDANAVGFHKFFVTIVK